MMRPFPFGKIIAGSMVMALLLTTAWLDRKFRWESASRAALAVHPLRISGTVTDAQTGGPVAGLTVTRGSPLGNSFFWGTSAKYPGTTDRYEEIFRSPPTDVTRSTGGLVEVVLKFKAPGFQPLVSRGFRPNGGSVTFDVRLQRAAMTRGIVLSTDGTPVTDAEVLVLSKSNPSWLHLDRGSVHGWRGDRCGTDEHGRFELESPQDDFRLLVAHPSGFAVLPGKSSESELRLMLQPWARLEGRWLAGGRPDGVTALSYGTGQQWDISISMSVAYSPNDGTFVAAEIPPGPFTLHWQPRRQSGEPFTFVELARGDAPAGKTTNLECSTEFRIVTGQVVRDGSTSGLKFEQCSVSLSPVHATAPPLPPETNTPEEQEVWWAQWRATEEGRAHAATANRRRQINVQADGRFISPFVFPGSYWLSGVWRDGQHSQGRIEQRRVEVIAGSGALDLGKFTVVPNGLPFLNKGQPAPPFSVPGLTSGTVSLNARPGKFVLLDFWATDCGPCIDEIPQLRALFERYRHDPRFEIISLDLDSSPQRAGKFAGAHRMDWSQGHLAGGWKNPVAISYGINAIPALFLIGPDGKILARDLRGVSIEAEVADALRE